MSSHALHVVVVGAGPSGLAAAIGLRKSGHGVTIVERSSAISAVSNGIVLGPNVTKVLDYYGMDYAQMGGVLVQGTAIYSGKTLDCIARTPGIDPAVWGSDGYLCMRSDLAQGLYQLAVKDHLSEEAGPSVEMLFDHKVSEFDPSNGSVHFEDGSSHTADLVVAADGVYSKAALAIAPVAPNISQASVSVIRLTFSISELEADPVTAPLVTDKGHFIMFIGPNPTQYVVAYPCRESTVLSLSVYDLASTAPDKTTSRHETSREDLVQKLKDFHPSIRALADKLTSEKLPTWHLSTRPRLDTWHNDRLVVIGDAAHPMLPNQGQGAGMGIEDGCALGIALSDLPADNLDAAVKERLKLFEQLRKGRAEAVQCMSDVPFFQEIFDVKGQEIKSLLGDDAERVKTAADLRYWVGIYNVVTDSHRMVQESLQTMPKT